MHTHQHKTAVQLSSGNETGKKGAYHVDNRDVSNAIQRKANNTGLPDSLKSGIENLSGHSMDDVKVHYNSSQPAQLNAHAYAQGNQIHVAPGQEKHLPHEAWHVVQQKEGRVKPTMQLKGKVNVNDDSSLEKEADVMGAKALQMKQVNHSHSVSPRMTSNAATVQLYHIDARTNHVVTDDGHYRMSTLNPVFLYAHQNAARPRPANFFMGLGTRNIQNSRGEMKTFDIISGRALFGPPTWVTTGYQIFGGVPYWHQVTNYLPYNGLNDCGMYARGVSRNIPAWGRGTRWIAWTALGWMVFGQNFGSYNLLAPVLNARRDKEARPQAGHTLLMQPPAGSIKGVTSEHANRGNFHAAPVVIRAGSDYITNEADATNIGRNRPHWKISGSKKAGQSWHESNKHAYKDNRARRAAAGGDGNIWPTTTLLH